MKGSNCNNFLNKKDFDLIISFVILFVLLSIIFLFLVYYNYEALSKNDTVYEIKEVEVIGKGKINLPKSIAVDEPYDFIIPISKYKKLGKNSIATFFSYANVLVYADNKLIYEIKKPENSLFKSNAYQSCVFELPEEMKSDYIKVHVDPLLKTIGKSKISQIVIGNKSDILIEKIKSEILTDIMIVILIVNFIIILFINMKNKDFFDKEHYSILSLSVYGLITSIYFMTQSWTPTYFLADFKEFIYALEYISFMASFVPALYYIKYKVNTAFYVFFDLMIALFVSNLILQAIFSSFHIFEYREMLFVVHFLMFLAMVLIFIAVICTDQKQFPSKKTLVLPIIAILITTVLSLIYYIVLGLHVLKTAGILIPICLIVIEIKEFYHKFLEDKKEKIKNEVYKKLAVTDALTGMSNRQAHEEFVEMINREKRSGWILSIDINNLKYVNDSLGHIMGDKLITNLSSILLDLEEKDKKVHAFRIGGDEFFIFVEESFDFNINTLVDSLKIKYNAKRDFGIDFIPSFSAGYRYYNPIKTERVMEIYNEADQLMYKEKARYKKEYA